MLNPRELRQRDLKQKLNDLVEGATDSRTFQKSASWRRMATAVHEDSDKLGADGGSPNEAVRNSRRRWKVVTAEILTARQPFLQQVFDPTVRLQLSKSGRPLSLRNGISFGRSASGSASKQQR